MRRPLAGVLALWTLACGGAGAVALVSVEQEIAIGRQADAEVRKQVPVFTDRETAEYVRSLGRKMLAHAPGPKYPYSFDVADYREINAFALPGGPIWIHRGLLHAAGNEAQVAGVVAHEIAHIAQRHAADQLTKATVANLGLGLLGAVLGNGGGAGAAQMAAGLLANGIFLKFSRDDEREADRVGLQMMARAGWDPRGMVQLFEVLQQESRRNPGAVEVFFSSHPSPQDRIARLRDDVARQRGGTLDSPRFRALKARLLKMPAPRAMPRQ